jgi:hypothetical protein
MLNIGEGRTYSLEILFEQSISAMPADCHYLVKQCLLEIYSFGKDIFT